MGIKRHVFLLNMPMHCGSLQSSYVNISECQCRSNAFYSDQYYLCVVIFTFESFCCVSSMRILIYHDDSLYSTYREVFECNHA